MEMWDRIVHKVNVLHTTGDIIGGSASWLGVVHCHLNLPSGFLDVPAYVWGVVSTPAGSEVSEDKACVCSSLPAASAEVDGVAAGWALDNDVGGGVT